MARGASLKHEQRFTDVPRRERLPTSPTQPQWPAQLKANVLANLRRGETFYRPEFVQLVIEDMSQGYSFSGFAGRIGVARTTIRDWRAVHPAFDAACAYAEAAKARFYETGFVKALEEEKSGAVQGWIFGMLNSAREDWKNKHDVDVNVQITLGDLIRQSLKKPETMKVIEHVQASDLFGSEDE